MILDGFPGGAPELRPNCRAVVISLVPGPIATTAQLAQQHAKYSIKPAGIKGYEKIRMQVTKTRKINAAT